MLSKGVRHENMQGPPLHVFIISINFSINTFCIIFRNGKNNYYSDFKTQHLIEDLSFEPF